MFEWACSCAVVPKETSLEGMTPSLVRARGAPDFVFLLRLLQYVAQPAVKETRCHKKSPDVKMEDTAAHHLSLLRVGFDVLLHLLLPLLQIGPLLVLEPSAG